MTKSRSRKFADIMGGTFSSMIEDGTIDPSDITGLHTVATSGSFDDLSDKPAPFDPNTLATVATTGAYSSLTGKPTLGTAAATASTSYATAAQGALADSATQPSDLATVATSGSYNDLTNTPAPVDTSSFMLKSANSQLDMNNNDIVGVDQIYHEADSNTYIQFHAADQFRVVTGGSERLEVNNSRTQIDNLLVTGTTTLQGSVTGAGGLGTWSLHASGNAINTTNAYSFGSTTGTFFIEVWHDRSGEVYTGRVYNTSGAMIVNSDGGASTNGGSVSSGLVYIYGMNQYRRAAVIVKTNGSNTYLYGFGSRRTYYRIWRML